MSRAVKISKNDFLSILLCYEIIDVEDGKKEEVKDQRSPSFSGSTQGRLSSSSHRELPSFAKACSSGNCSTALSVVSESVQVVIRRNQLDDIFMAILSISDHISDILVSKFDSRANLFMS